VPHFRHLGMLHRTLLCWEPSRCALTGGCTCGFQQRRLRTLWHRKASALLQYHTNNLGSLFDLHVVNNGRYIILAFDVYITSYYSLGDRYLALLQAELKSREPLNARLHRHRPAGTRVVVSASQQQKLTAIDFPPFSTISKVPEYDLRFFEAYAVARMQYERRDEGAGHPPPAEPQRSTFCAQQFLVAISSGMLNSHHFTLSPNSHSCVPHCRFHGPWRLL
jgi:hypothetical protein